jgi:hypothetical protein
MAHVNSAELALLWASIPLSVKATLTKTSQHELTSL